MQHFYSISGSCTIDSASTEPRNGTGAIIGPENPSVALLRGFIARPSPVNQQTDIRESRALLVATHARHLVVEDDDLPGTTAHVGQNPDENPADKEYYT